MTLAGAAVATFAAALTLVRLTGGCGNPTDTSGYDQPGVVAPAPARPPVPVPLTTWGD